MSQLSGVYMQQGPAPVTSKRPRAAFPPLKKLVKSSQVKLLITNNAFCIVQRATAQSKTGIFRDFGVAEAPPGFQAGWSDCMYFFSLSLSLSLLILPAHLGFPCKFLYS
jgi:hypothetical protein